MTRFHPGQRVHTVTDDPPVHVRLPRYARGREGVVEAVHAPTAVPAQAAAGVGNPDAEPVYTVRFLASALWGRAAEPATAMHLEVWEHHLRPHPDEPEGQR